MRAIFVSLDRVAVLDELRASMRVYRQPRVIINPDGITGKVSVGKIEFGAKLSPKLGPIGPFSRL